MKKIVLLLMLVGQAHALESIVWDKSVIQLNLIVGVDQVVRFENGVEGAELSKQLGKRDVFRHTLNNDVALWRAFQAIESERIVVQIGNDEIMFDITAKLVKSPPKSVEQIVIVSGHAPAQAPPPRQIQPAGPSVFELIQFAAQVDELPEWVRYHVEGIRQVETTSKELSPLYKDPYTRAVDMYVKHAWAVSNLYVTAISIRNRTNMAFRIDPSRFEHTVGNSYGGREGFVVSGMIQRELGPRGQKVGKRNIDEVMLYVVTDEPFHTTINLGS